MKFKISDKYAICLRLTEGEETHLAANVTKHGDALLVGVTAVEHNG